MLKNNEQRQANALKPNWRDLIPIHEIKDFLFCEHVYCKEEENNFYDCDESNVDKKEYLRTIILEKRKEFLMLWLKKFPIQ